MRALPIALLLAGCDEIFTIDAGDHSSTSRIEAFSGSSLAFRAGFDESAIYTTADPANQADINKLFGFSDCTSFHQDNSARFGWRWYDGELQVLAYTYADGVRDDELVGVVEIGGDDDYLIEIDGDTYRFSLNGGDPVVMDRGCDGSGGIKYHLWPYFGGDETAPHEITIWLEY